MYKGLVLLEDILGFFDIRNLFNDLMKGGLHMADLIITAAQVIPGSGALYREGFAASAITAGDCVYRNANGKFAAANSALTAMEANVEGIAAHGASANQPIKVQYAGVMTLGAGAAPASGIIYLVSNTAGGLAVTADIGANDFVSIVCVGIGNNQVKLCPFASGAQR